MIWVTVSSWSCFCWLYRPSPSLAAKYIINLILILTIWWCPCVESSLVLLEEDVCYDQCVLLAKLVLAFDLLHSVLQDQIWASLVAQMVNHLTSMWETRNRSPGLEDPLEKEMATHCSTLAWKIWWTEEPGKLQSVGVQWVKHNWANILLMKQATCRFLLRGPDGTLK